MLKGSDQACDAGAAGPAGSGSGEDHPFEQLRVIMARLRAEGGCPWDRAQTLQTLKPFVIEEAYELLDAIDDGDPDKHCEELGDLLLQVFFQAQIQAEMKAFDVYRVARKLGEKLVRRHPHVFGDRHAADADAVLRDWAEIKAEEKRQAPSPERASALGSVPRTLPSLQKAQQVQVRAARVGFDWPDVDGVIAKIDEELGELKQALAQGDESRIKAETGDLLFSVVNLSRFHRVNAEEALDEMINRFIRRFHAVEDAVHADGRTLTDCSLTELDAAWEAAKREIG